MRSILIHGHGSLSYKEFIKLWLKVALYTFDGPTRQIALIHQLVVEEKKWVSEERFLHALNFCMLLPGPEAQQLATYMGWLSKGWRGGLIAGGLFILPGFLSILALSYLYVLYLEVPIVAGIFYGMKPAIIAIVMAALIKISKRSLKSIFYWVLAAFAFIALFFFHLPFPLVIFSGAILGLIYGRFFQKPQEEVAVEIKEKPCGFQMIKTAFLWLGIWFTPLAFCFFYFGGDSTLVKMSFFFSKMAVVTFGGAYATLSYMAQQAVDVFSWLAPGQMIDGLGMAETTPGPLIQVVQFVGFMGAYRFPDVANPYVAAFLGSLISTWMTFAPCFLWIFAGAPYIEFIRGQKLFSDALEAITACVVGVIMNLSLWFSLQVLFKENFEPDYIAMAICSLALFLQFKLKQGMFTILGVSAIIGILAVSFLG